MSSPTYPGTPEHQRLLRAIADQYADDPRVLAVAVFGSLGRGSWDRYSDLDLDVVTADGLSLDVLPEVRRLCTALGYEPLVVVPDRDDAADVVLPSLIQFSIRYHPLQTTKVNIVESLVVLTGRIDRAAIVAAGLANGSAPPPSPADLLSSTVRQAICVDIKLHRKQLWVAYHVLHDARERLLRLFALSRGAVRPYHAFQAAADAALKAQFIRTLPHDDLASMQRAFLGLLDLLEHDVPAISAGQLQLTEAQHQVVAQLRARQATLDLPSSASPDVGRQLPDEA